MTPDSPQITYSPKQSDVVVNLGDSFTDGYTYPLLVLQALKEAGKPRPVFVNAGIAGALSKPSYVSQQIELFKPRAFTLLSGGGISVEEYEKYIRGISAQAKASGMTMILITPPIVDHVKRKETPVQTKEYEQRLAGYGDVIRRIAREEQYPVADSFSLMRKAADAGQDPISADGIHPNYLGQSMIARALLDSMGYADVPLPKEFKPPLLPGVIATWKMRPAPLDEQTRQPLALNEKTVAELEPDNTWKTYTLPDPAPTEMPAVVEWSEQERRCGFALQIQKVVGASTVQAVAIFDSNEEKTAYINTGVGVQTVWFNGKKIHTQSGAWTGYHAGKERYAVHVQKGRNSIVVEISGNEFFLSLTEKLMWEQDL